MVNEAAADAGEDFFRDEFGDVQPAFYLPQPNVMEFTRRGWRNPVWWD